MIFDNIKNIERYKNLNDVYAALTAIKENKVDTASLSENIRIMHNNVVTENASLRKFESHRVYADIHYCIKGTEKIEMTLGLDGMSRIGEYNDDDDFEVFETPNEKFSIVLTEGEFLVVYPNQGHKPLCSVGADAELEKYVVKIKMN